MRKNKLISEEESRIIWFSFLLGIISISCAWVIGEKAFESTVIKLEQQYRKFYLREAKILVRTAAAGDFENDASLLRSIDEAWKNIEDKPADEYLCVVDKGSRLLLHSAFPETVGNDAGSNPIFSQRPEAESCLRDLAISQNEYVGDYISSDGKQQLAAFAPIPDKHWTVGLHRSKSALVDEIESGIKYIRYGFFVVCILLMPLSWLLLFFIFRRAENRKRKTLAALQGSEENYRNIFENAVEGFYQSTPDGHFTSVNPAFVNMFGYASADELVSSDFDIDRHFYANPEDRTQWKQILEKNGKVQSYEFQAKRKDGSHFWVSDSTRAIFDQDGKIVSYEGNLSDITERREAESTRKKIEDELLKRNHFIETILDNLPIGLAVNFINEGKAFYINKNFEKIYGWPKEELQDIEEFFSKIYPDNEYRDQIKSMILSDINSGDPERMQWEGIEITNKLGKKRIVTAKNIPLYEQNLMISIVQDITESASLQTRLQQAQKMEAIGSLAGGIAHDFNNILFPIMGLSELLMEDLPHGSPEYGNVQQIFNAGKRGSDLVKQILAFGRQSEKKMMPVLIQQILKEVFKLSRSTISSDIEITLKIQIDCGRVMADPVQLHQISMNLITNAYHAVEETEEKKIIIQLRETKIESADADLSGKSLEPGQYAVLSVVDTGCGIDPAILDKIFEPYFTTKEKGKGTGLGLATVYGIAKEYGGDIKVYSELGKGTTFDIYFPILSNNNDIEDIEKIEASVGGTESILLVEDEESVFKLEKLILERLGYQVIGRTSSIEALEAFKANQDNFDLVLTDMNMPNMTGAQLAEKIKAIKPEMPIIICTGFSDRINKEKAKSVGIDGFLMKPIVKSEMAKMIRNVLEEREGERGSINI